jgi:Trypsin
LVHNFTANPWTVVGRIEVVRSIKESSIEYGICSGTLISRHIVLTAAHCLYDARLGYFNHIVFTPSTKIHTSLPNRFKGTPLLLRPIGTSFDNNLDMAFVILKDSPIQHSSKGHNTLIPLAVVGSQHFEQRVDHPLILLAAGYPEALGGKTLIVAATNDYRQSIVVGKTNQIEHTAATGEGSSGGPVFAWHPATRQFALIGIISSQREWSNGANLHQTRAVAITLNTTMMRYVTAALHKFEPDWKTH